MSFPEKYEPEVISSLNRKIMILEEKYNNQYYFDVLNSKKNQIEYIKNIIKDSSNTSKSSDNNHKSINNKFNTPQLEKIFLLLHKLSINKGGFLSISNRKIIYKYIINKIYDYNNLSRYHESDLKFADPKDIENVKNIIEKDCERSVLFSICTHDSSKYEKEITHDEIRNYINNLKLFVLESLGKTLDISYFQGYQEICLFFMIIFGEKEGPDLMNKFSKIFFNYLSCRDIENKVDFNYVLDLLNAARNEINPSSKNLLDNITKTKPFYALSWVITWFTHDNHSLFKQLRLIDYFITSELSAVFFFVGALISFEFDKLTKLYNITNKGDNWDDLMGDIFQHFQKIEFESGEVIEQLIRVTERNNFDGNFKNVLKNYTQFNFDNKIIEQICNKQFPYSISPPFMYNLNHFFRKYYKIIFCTIALIVLYFAFNYYNKQN